MHWRRNRAVNRGKQCWEQRVLFKGKAMKPVLLVAAEQKGRIVGDEIMHALLGTFRDLVFPWAQLKSPWRAVKVMTPPDWHQILTRELRVSRNWQMTEWTMKVWSLEADCWPLDNFENSCERSAWLSAMPIWSREYHLRRLGKVIDPSCSLDNTM